MSDICVITTLPNNAFEVYGRAMIQSFVQNWPEEIPLLIALDDALLADQINSMLRPQDAIAAGWEQDHRDFVARNKDRDDPNNYRKQAVRFCHKVFAINRAYTAMQAAKEANEKVARYLVWMDADVITNRPVTMAEIRECLPKEGDAVAYLGRKDWPHSECGWLAFDLENGAERVIQGMVNWYLKDALFDEKEWHDSWLWDQTFKAHRVTNLTEDKPGMDIWPHSPMGKWSTHHKGPVAKQKMVPKPTAGSNIVIQTKNSIPDEKIHEQIKENQDLIKNWIGPCTPTDEEIVVVSAGPQLIAEDVLPDYNAGKKIIAVKHALGRLKEVGIKPWACILLDPRPHVANFVKDADTDVLWFVASQVDPNVTKTLLAKGCTVWGYHASVGAGEQVLTSKQAGAVINGGSATATRGLFVLKQLGFRKVKLYGYDLCFPDKPDLNARDEHGQPKFLEMSVGWNHPLSNAKKMFFSEPQLIAQFEEFNQLIQTDLFDLEAVGDGMVPFILKHKKLGDLRSQKFKVNIEPKTYEELLWNKKKRISSLMKPLRNLLKIPHKRT